MNCNDTKVVSMTPSENFVKITWLGKWMYNPTTQIQVLTEANLDSYYFKNKNHCRGFPYRIPLKKSENFVKITESTQIKATSYNDMETM